MTGRHRIPRRRAHALPGTASSPALSGAADLVLDLVDPVPDDGAEQWLDGVRSGWTRDSLATVRNYRRFGWVKPLSVAERKAQEGRADVTHVGAACFQAACEGCTTEGCQHPCHTGDGDAMLLAAIPLGALAAVFGIGALIVHYTGRAAEAAWHLARKAARRAV